MKTAQHLSALRQFVKMESFTGILLMFSCLLALIIANSPLKDIYNSILSFSISVNINHIQASKSVLHWINDGLMAIFFMLIGLELKREIVEGNLSSLPQIVLPAVAALGGVLFPVFIYLYFNFKHVDNIHGWAIPAATDIAFALGVLSLLGKRIPLSLKAFLLALAIFDDLIAIIIIAVFYTAKLSALSLMLSFGAIIVLFILNRFQVKNLLFYMLVGLFLWLFVLNSGVHATLSGVILACFIPRTLLHTLEKAIHPWVMYFILPLFALANTGIDLSQVSLALLSDPLLLGIMCGLFVGKQVGIFSFSLILIKTKLVKMPNNATWMKLYGVAVLGGIGFTMSLFISSLAFNEIREESRLGVLLGSLLSAFLGYFILRLQKDE